MYTVNYAKCLVAILCNNQIKVSGSADILRDIPIQISVHQLASKLRCFEGDVIYVQQVVILVEKGDKAVCVNKEGLRLRL